MGNDKNTELFKNKSVEMLLRKKKKKPQVDGLQKTDKQYIDEDKKSPEYKIFEHIFERKFVNACTVSLAQKNKTLANKGQPNKEKETDFGIPKSQSIGSLLPRLRELELISISDKRKPKDKIK